MIRASLAIAAITIRQACNTRALAWLFAAAALPAVLLPFHLASPANPAATYTLLATYVPPLIFAVVITGAIWLGCASIASERSQQQLAMLRTKPVGGGTIWCGKWLGVNGICLFLLLCAGSLFYLATQVRLAQRDVPPPTVWQPFLPDETALRATARQNLVKWRKAAPDPSLVPSLQQESNRLRQQNYQTRAGSPVTWTIPVEASADKTRWALQFQFRVHPMQRQPIAGTWLLDHPDAGTTLGTFPVENLLDGLHQIPLQDLTLPPHTKSVQLQFIPEAPQPTIFFDAQSPVRLLRQAASLPANLARAGILLLACVAALSAIAILLSSCLSFPVALFSAYASLVALVIASVARALDVSYSHAHSHGTPRFGDSLLALSHRILSAVQSAASALQDLLPFDALANAYLVPIAPATKSLLLFLLVIPALSALLTAWRMSRQEVST